MKDSCAHKMRAEETRARFYNSQRLHQVVDPSREIVAGLDEGVVSAPRRIFDRPVLDAFRARPVGTIGGCRIADGNTNIERLGQKFVGPLRLRVVELESD